MTVNSYRKNRTSTTTSKYFDYLNRTSEQNLYNSLIVENIKHTGFDVWYIPRSYLEIDPILKEPTKSTFDNAYKIEAYMSNPSDGYGGADVMTRFGMSAAGEVELIISKESFRKLNIPGLEYNRPREGDLIFVSAGSKEMSLDFFEITFVDYQKWFFSLGKSFTYALSCVSFTFNYEEFNTNVPEIDQVVTPTANLDDLTLGTNLGIKDKENLLLNFTEKNPFGFD